MPSLSNIRQFKMAVNKDGKVTMNLNGTLFEINGFAWRKTFKGKRCVVVHRKLDNGTRIIALLSLKGRILAALDIERYNINEQIKVNSDVTEFLKLSRARCGNKIFETNVDNFFADEKTQQNTEEFELIDPNATEDGDITGCCLN
jgi:hypothetical protein